MYRYFIQRIVQNEQKNLFFKFLFNYLTLHGFTKKNRKNNIMNFPALTHVKV